MNTSITQTTPRPGHTYVHNRKDINILSVPQMAFEPEVLEDIQVIDSDTHRIPHIIHFIFISGIKGKDGIPAFYKPNVKSFLHFNPNWTYYFWSESSARQLISSRHPSLLSTWDSYPRVINKADALRYVLLYEFGGVYADLDMKCMRPLDRATIKYSCVLSPEPFEHSAILYKIPFLLSTAFMMCRPKHPFMKQAILRLPEFSERRQESAKAGPMFMTEMFKIYNKLQPGDGFRMKTDFKSNSPYFYKGSIREDDDNAVYIVNTLYFMNSYDARVNFKRLCGGSNKVIVKRGCILWDKRKHETIKNSFSFVDHNWAHIYSITNAIRLIPIRNAIPGSNLKIWSEGTHTGGAR